MTNELLLRYMIAHIRLHTTADISKWSQDQLIESFATLPMPATPPDEWARRMGLVEPEPAPSQEEVDMARAKELGAKILGFVNYHNATFPKQKKEEKVA